MAMMLIRLADAFAPRCFGIDSADRAASCEFPVAIDRWHDVDTLRLPFCSCIRLVHLVYLNLTHFLIHD